MPLESSRIKKKKKTTHKPVPSGLRYRINTESFLPVLFPLLSGQRSEISKWEEESGSISVCVFLSLSFTISASMVYAPSILPYALLLWLGMFHWALGLRWTDRDPQASLIFFFFFMELCCLCTAFMNCTLFCTHVWIFYTKVIMNDIKNWLDFLLFFYNGFWNFKKVAV